MQRTVFCRRLVRDQEGRPLPAATLTHRARYRQETDLLTLYVGQIVFFGKGRPTAAAWFFDEARKAPVPVGLLQVHNAHPNMLLEGGYGGVQLRLRDAGLHHEGPTGAREVFLATPAGLVRFLEAQRSVKGPMYMVPGHSYAEAAAEVERHCALQPRVVVQDTADPEETGEAARPVPGELEPEEDVSSVERDIPEEQKDAVFAVLALLAAPEITSSPSDRRAFRRAVQARQAREFFTMTGNGGAPWLQVEVDFTATMDHLLYRDSAGSHVAATLAQLGAPAPPPLALPPLPVEQTLSRWFAQAIGAAWPTAAPGDYAQALREFVEAQSGTKVELKKNSRDRMRIWTPRAHPLDSWIRKPGDGSSLPSSEGMRDAFSPRTRRPSRPSLSG